MKFNTSQAKELHQLSLFTDVVFDKMYKNWDKMFLTKIFYSINKD